MSYRVLPSRRLPEACQSRSWSSWVRGKSHGRGPDQWCIESSTCRSKTELDSSKLLFSFHCQSLFQFLHYFNFVFNLLILILIILLRIILLSYICPLFFLTVLRLICNFISFSFQNLPHNTIGVPETFDPTVSEITTNDVTPSMAATIVRGLGQELI